MQGTTTNAKQANTGVLYVTFDAQNETWDLHSENGACLFYSKDVEAVTDYLDMIGAVEINDLTWEIDNGTLSKITNGQG